MKKGNKKIIFAILGIIAIVSVIIIAIVSNKMENKSSTSTGIGEENPVLASVSIKTKGGNYIEKDTGEIVIGGSHRNGFCMKKGASLYGGRDQLYDNGSAYGSNAYVNVLYDNIILPFGNDSSRTFYQTKLEKLVKRYGQNDTYDKTDWKVFEAEQYAFWHYTNGTNCPKSQANYKLYNALVNEANYIVKADSNQYGYGQKDLKGQTKVSIDKSNAKIQVSGNNWTIGPFKLNNECDEFFYFNMTDITFTENGQNTTIKNFDIVNNGKKVVKGYSDYYGWDGEFYITFSHSFQKGIHYNVKLGLNALTYTTTAKIWRNGNRQPVATLTRTPQNHSAEFNDGYSEPVGNYHINLSKRSTDDVVNTKDDLNDYSRSLSAKFKLKLRRNGEDGKDIDVKSNKGSITRINWDNPLDTKNNSNINIDSASQDWIFIEETEPPTGFDMPIYKRISLRISKKLDNNNVWKLERIEVWVAISNGQDIYLKDIKAGDYKIYKDYNWAIDTSDNTITVTAIDKKLDGEYSLGLLKKSMDSTTDFADTSDAIGGAIVNVKRNGASKNYITEENKIVTEKYTITDTTDDVYEITEIEAPKGYIKNQKFNTFNLKLTVKKGIERYYNDTHKYIVEDVKAEIIHTTGGVIAETINLTKDTVATSNIIDGLRVKFTSDQLLVEIKDPKIEPINLSIQKVSSENNEEFLKNTNLQISKTVLNEKGDAETSDAEIFSGTLENANVGNDEAKYKYTEENIEEGYTYYYDILENEPASGFKNVFGNVKVRLKVKIKNGNISETSVELNGDATDEQKAEMMKYVGKPTVDEATRTVSLVIENPKDVIPMKLKLFKHQLDDKNTPVKNAIFSVKEIDANGNKVNDLTPITTDGTNQLVANIDKGEIGKSYYYELEETTIPKNYTNVISGVRVKLSIDENGKVSSSITNVKKVGSNTWEQYSNTYEKYTTISDPDTDNNIILYIANSVKFDFTLYKKNYASNNTDLEKAEKFNGTATFKIEDGQDKEIFNGTLNDAQTFFEEIEAKANSTYVYKVTETSVSDEFYDSLVNIPIKVTIRTDENGKIKDESNEGSNWSFADANLTEEQKNILKNLIDLKIAENNHVNLFIANMPKNYYSVQVIKVDNKGNIIKNNEATFSVSMTTDNEQGEGIAEAEHSTKEGILNIPDNDDENTAKTTIDPSHTHTYTIKEETAPKGYDKLLGKVELAAKFTDDGKLLKENINLKYFNENNNEEQKDGLTFKYDNEKSIPIIQIYLPNDSKPLEFELVKKNFKDEKVTAEEDSNGNLNGASFIIQRVNVHNVENKTTNVPNGTEDFFNGQVINDILLDGQVNDVVPAFTNLTYVYMIQEKSTKSEYAELFKNYAIELDVTTDDDAKIASTNYKVYDVTKPANPEVTEAFKENYGDFIDVTTNETRDKVIITIKNAPGYKVRLNKTDTKGNPIKTAKVVAKIDDKVKCVLNEDNQKEESSKISEDYISIAPGKSQTWQIEEDGTFTPYYNIFGTDKYIEVKVSMNNSIEMNVDSYTIKYKDTDQEIEQTELENLKKYISEVKFVKEGNDTVLNIVLKNPTIYRLKLTKYEADGTTELKGTSIIVNGKEVISNGSSYYTVDNIANIGDNINFTISEKSTAKNHINIFEKNHRYLSVGATILDKKEADGQTSQYASILYSKVYEHYNENPKPWEVASYDDIYNYIKVESTVDTDNVPVINVSILNPMEYEFDIEKVDTSKDGKALKDTDFEIYSPVLDEQSGKYKYVVNKEGVTVITDSGMIYGTTTENGNILFGEQNAKIGKEYEYKIVETKAASDGYVNLFNEYAIYVKAVVDNEGNVTLNNYDNGRNFELRKDDGTKAPEEYYNYVTVTVDTTGESPRIKVLIQNPTKVKIKINKKIFGNNKVNLKNTKFEVTSQISGTKELVTDSQGNIVLDESPIKEGIYEYIVKEKDTPGKDIINILSDNYVKFRLYVSADGNIYTVDENGNKADNTYYLYKADGSKIDFDNTNIDDFISINTSAKVENTSMVTLTVLDPQKYSLSILKQDKDTKEAMNGVTFDVTVKDEQNNEVTLKDANTMQAKNLKGLTTKNINGEDGVIKIDDILFEKAQTYTFILREKTKDGYLGRDDIEIKVKVEIVDGKYEVTDISYNNLYVNKENTKIIKDDASNIQIIQFGIDNERIKGSYDLVINKTDLEGINLDGAKVKITVLRDGKESELYEANEDVNSKNVIIPTKEIDVTNGRIVINNIRIEKPESYILKIEETQAPERYVKLEKPIQIKVTTKKLEDGINTRYVLESASIVEENSLVKQTSSENKLEVTIKNEQFDLALRKFITKITTNEGKENEKVQDITNRIPEEDTEELKTGVDTTAKYNHTKDPISLYAGDTVVYTIRVYNEAEIAGYAEEVTDHLPEYLEFVNDEFNSSYGWLLDEKDTSLRTVKTTYLSRANDEKGNLIKAFDKDSGKLDYKELKIKCRVKDNTPAELKLTNIAEISKYIGENGRDVVDRDSEVGNVILPTDSELPKYQDDKITEKIPYIPGQQDDDDFEKVLIQEFDLALRKFITGVTTNVGNEKETKTEVTTRIPVFKVDEQGKYVYEHTKEPVLVANQNVVEYTIRVYNEGTVNGYAKEIKDDIPDGLEFLPDDELNKEYRWLMLDEEGNETDDVTKAKYITSDYLSKEQEKTEGENLLKAFDKEAYDAGKITEPDYREVKVAFKVTMPNTSDEIIINQAQISDDSDEDGNEVTDKDSTPSEWIEGEDDQDIEKIKVQYFDLALRKWVTKAIVTENGKETVTETGHKAEDDPEEVVKVDLKKSKIKDVVVKFEYQIRVTNEGQIAGSVEEISDYIPEGLKFVAADNPLWKEVDGKVVTDQLAGQIMQPGESKEVTILLTWINREDNMGLKINVAEISKDYNEYGTPDIDSTPNNKVPGEDDIDDAPVMLTVTTGEKVMYLGIYIAVLAVIAVGIYGVKKYIIK